MGRGGQTAEQTAEAHTRKVRVFEQDAKSGQLSGNVREVILEEFDAKTATAVPAEDSGLSLEKARVQVEKEIASLEPYTRLLTLVDRSGSTSRSQVTEQQTEMLQTLSQAFKENAEAEAKLYRTATFEGPSAFPDAFSAELSVYGYSSQNGEAELYELQGKDSSEIDLTQMDKIGGGGAPIADALLFAADQFNGRANFAVLVITDGESHDPEQTKSISQSLHDRGIITSVILQHDPENDNFTAEQISEEFAASPVATVERTDDNVQTLGQLTSALKVIWEQQIADSGTELL